MSIEKLGISHTLPEGTTVLHSTIIGVNCLGRTTDLLSAWCKNEFKPDTVFLSDLRLLTQALLEFSCPKSGEILGQLELAQSQGLVILATRFPCRLTLNPLVLEKELTQYWLNSEELKLLKRMLSPQDRVEVRYHEKLNLIEWRVCRPMGLAQVMDHADSFRVLTDTSADIDANGVNFLDLGDLPFNEWLTAAYKNTQSGNRAGSVTIEGGESQDDQEWARVVVEREKDEIERDLEMIFKSEFLTEEEVIHEFSNQLDGSSSDTELKRARIDLSIEEIDRILAENKNLKDAAREVSVRIRKLELASDREKILFQKKTTQLEDLLRKKEYLNQRMQNEVKSLHQKVADQLKNPDTSRSNHFKEKALEMFEQLKRVKEENKSMERMLIEVKRKEREASEVSSTGGGMNQKYLDELTKKMERTQRALDGEKLKVKTLSERVIIAEKEAQSAGPLIDDLESKVEHTLKVAQQHKKETEVVKQKLIQADAEKNKIKNELVKLHAQVATLQKRQAS
jgi:hypothetical protein